MKHLSGRLLPLLLLLLSGMAFAGGKGLPTSPSEAPADDSLTIDSKGNHVFLRGDLGALNAEDGIGSQSLNASAINFLNNMMGPSLDRSVSQTLAVRKSVTDQAGNVHIRILQEVNGLPVEGAEMVVHAFGDGQVYAVNGIFADPAGLATSAAVDADTAIADAARKSNIRAYRQAGLPSLTYVMGEDGQAFLAWRVTIMYDNADGPQKDILFADAGGSDRIARHPQYHYAKNRRTHDANNGTSLPGTLVRTEGSGNSGDVALDAAHNNAGKTYDYYNTKFGRDSYNNAGATLTSTVHFRTNYNNAFWNGSQMVYGDGDGTTFIELSRSLDVVAHELTHAVTSSESNLIYQNESGALNEAMSDILGCATEAWDDGGISADTWRLGEDIYTPGIANDALRYINDPALAGDRDYYPDRYTGSADNGGVHTNSGIANLAFYLMVQGGTHPRGKTTNNVTAVGLSKAEQIFYRANTIYLTASSNFEACRNATAQAATDLYGSAETSAVHEAWDAVGVPGSGGTPGGCSGTNYNGSLSGTGSQQFQPNGTYYFAGSGNHSGTLAGPSGTDFDLYLWKWNGFGWSTVASSLSASSNESISYNGSSGYYAWRVYSYSGSGSYTLCLDTP